MGAVEWRDAAACRARPADLFFRPENESEARALCARCPVREPCLAFALDTRQKFGVWGGMSPEERAGWVRPRPGLRLRTVTYSTRARSTGSVCAAGRTDVGGWGVACRDHGTTAATTSRAAAERAASRPEQWCGKCTD